jgi:hypothetical protein
MGWYFTSSFFFIDILTLLFVFSFNEKIQWETFLGKKKKKGLAYVGSRGIWCNGFSDIQTMAHEIGHTIGAYHANFYNEIDDVNVEYGNNMGNFKSSNNNNISSFKLIKTNINDFFLNKKRYQGML